MSLTLDQAMRVERIAEDRLRWQVPEGWRQGRGAFGGIVVGALVRAVLAVEDDPRRVFRSVTAEIVGPVSSGEATVRVELLRRGNAISAVRAWLVQGTADEVLAHAVVVLGADRPDTPTWRESELPWTSPWSEVAAVHMPPGLAPEFTQHFEYRPTGPLPFSGHPRAEAAGFIRANAVGDSRDAAILIAHADAYWLAGITRFEGPRPAATLAFTLHAHGDLRGVDLEREPLYHSAHSAVASAGYTGETRQLYAPNGDLLAENHQLIAIIK